MPSSAFLPFVAATSCLAAAAFLGAVALGARRFSDRLTVTLALGLLEVTWLVKLLLVIGAFRPAGASGGAVLLLIGTVGTAAAVPRARARLLALRAVLRRRAARRPRDPFALPAAALLGLVAVMYARSLVLALRLPPRDVDSLWYHLVAVAAWVRTGEMAPPIENLSKAGDLGWTVAADTYPRDTETVSAWLSVFTHNTSLVGLTQFPFLALLFASTYGICRRLGSTRGLALSGASAVVLAPTVLSQSYMAYNDIARAGAAVAVWHVLLMAYPEARDKAAGLAPRTALLLTGALLGLGMGIKAATGYLIPAALAAGLVLRRAADPATRPGRIAGALWVVGPAVLLGAYWYLRTWMRWGSPVWPLALGPFEGPKTMDYLIEEVRPEEWRGEPMPLVVLRSWWSAIGRTGDPHWYVEWTGQLGLLWLLVLLPAVALCVALAVWKRVHVRAAFGVVLPLAVGTLAAPGQWYSRYTMPLLAAGVAACAVLVGQLASRERVRRLGPRLVPAATAVVGVLAAASLVGQVRYTTFQPIEEPGQHGFGQAAQALAESPRDRSLEGVWGPYRRVDNLPPGTRIGFCAEDTPQYWAPLVLIGRDYDRLLVDLGECRTPSRVPVLMRRAHVTHLYTSRDSRIGRAVAATAGEIGVANMRIAPFRGDHGWMLQLYRFAPAVRPPAPPAPAAPPVPPATGGTSLAAPHVVPVTPTPDRR